VVGQFRTFILGAARGHQPASPAASSRAHGQREARTGQRDENWPVWYAEYMVREQTGEELPLYMRIEEKHLYTEAELEDIDQEAQ